MSCEWINGEGIWPADSRILILAFLRATSLPSLLRPCAFRRFPTPATDRSAGAQPPTITSLSGGRPQEAEATAWLAVTGVRQVDVAWHLPAHHPSARGIRLLLLLCGDPPSSANL
jgi:hypothetical protein